MSKNPHRICNEINQIGKQEFFHSVFTFNIIPVNLDRQKFGNLLDLFCLMKELDKFDCNFLRLLSNYVATLKKTHFLFNIVPNNLGLLSEDFSCNVEFADLHETCRKLIKEDVLNPIAYPITLQNLSGKL